MKFLLTMNMFFTYHEYVFKSTLTACMIVFESTEVMTKFLACGGGLVEFHLIFFSETGLKMRTRNLLF